MSIKLVGVFDSDGQATHACTRLVDAGIDRQSIHVEPGAMTTVDPRRDEDTTDRRGFFARLFGAGDDDAATHYGEAVRRGHAVLSVDLADEDCSDEVNDILEDCGAIDVDERVEEWKVDGYMPPAARPGTADGNEQTLRSIQENPNVGTRLVQRGRVRIHRMPATEAELQSAFQDRDIEIRETAEEPSTKFEVGDDSDVPAAPRRYSGRERRFDAGSNYAGAERRAVY